MHLYKMHIAVVVLYYLRVFGLIIISPQIMRILSGRYIKPILGLYFAFSHFSSSIRPHLIMGEVQILDFWYGKNHSRPLYLPQLDDPYVV